MRIYATRRLPGSIMQTMSNRFQGHDFEYNPEDERLPRDVLLEKIRGCHAVMSMLTDRVDEEFFVEAGPQLIVVSNFAVGYDNMVLEDATRHGVYLTNTPDVLTETTADTAWALLMASARRLGEAERFIRSGVWKQFSPSLLLGVDVWGKTLGIFGYGRIGAAVARRAQAFKMRVIYHKRNRLSQEEEVECNLTYVDKDTLLKESDFISIHCPLTAETHHAFGAEEFKTMRRNAVLVNTARGPVVDEDALVHALKHNLLFAAGLDVYEEEPKIHPGLLECENAFLIPHLGSATQDTRDRMAEAVMNNICAALEGRQPPNLLNKMS